MIEDERRPLRMAYCPACGASAGHYRSRPRRACRDVYCTRFGLRVAIAIEPGQVETANRLRAKWRPIRAMLAQQEKRV